MRKSFYIATFIIISSLFFSTGAFSALTERRNSCPIKPYPVSNFFTRGIQGLFGLNFGASKFAESQIKTQLSNLAQGDFDINLDTYSAMDLVAGKFKDLSINGGNISSNGVYISSFELKSLCDFIYLDYKSNPVVPLAPVFLSFKSTITQNDLNKTVSSKEFQNNLKQVKLSANTNNMYLVDFLDPEISIKNGKLYFESAIHLNGTPQFMKLPFKVGSGLKITNGKLKPTDVEISSKALGGELKPLAGMVDLMNPVLFNLKTLEKDGINVDITSLKISDQKIDAEGTLWIPSQKSKNNNPK